MLIVFFLLQLLDPFVIRHQELVIVISIRLSVLLCLRCLSHFLSCTVFEMSSDIFLDMCEMALLILLFNLFCLVLHALLNRPRDNRRFTDTTRVPGVTRHGKKRKRSDN